MCEKMLLKVKGITVNVTAIRYIDWMHTGWAQIVIGRGNLSQIIHLQSEDEVEQLKKDLAPFMINDV
jgi:hypothetical protein